MNVYKAAQSLMSMDDATWSRHANPWSVYTRIPVLPLLVFAIWSRVWIGWWALVPVMLCVVWVWLNPRAFGPPDDTDNWASRGVFGERVFLNREVVPVPAHHVAWGNGLSVISGLGLLPMTYGLWVLDAWATSAGTIMTVGAKLWFVDRMGWLYQDMKEADPDYTAWQRHRSNVAKTGA